jgi:hypothetical protein
MGSQRGSVSLSKKDKEKVTKSIKGYKKKSTDEGKPEIKINVAAAKRTKNE